MKILILTGHFYPEIHPRAFRAKELACNLAIKGHNVKVCTLRTIVDFDYKQYEKENNISIQRLNLYSQTGISQNIKSVTSPFNNRIFKLYRFLIDYFIAGSLFINAIRIKKKLKLSKDLDLVISLSTPFMNHMAMALIRKSTKNLKARFIADSGDPFYKSQQTKRAPYFYFIEKRIYKQYDYLTVPAEASIAAYKGLIASSKIRIIPQGFNLDNIKLAPFKRTKIVTFAYSGVFYSDIRNPKFLLDFLSKLTMDFRFEIYLRYKDQSISKLLSQYPNLLENKLAVTYAINRDDLLYNLSAVDFLINIDNTTTTQIPSKLIDYAITKRPIFTCNSSNFSEEVFMKFLNRDYSESFKIVLNSYDINHISKKFLELSG